MAPCNGVACDGTAAASRPTAGTKHSPTPSDARANIQCGCACNIFYVYIYIYQIFLHCRRNLSALHDVTDRSDTRLGQRIAHARGLATILTARRPPQRTRARCLCGMCVSAQRFACGREQLLPRACEPQAAQPALRPHAQCSAMSTRATSPRCDQPPSAASRQPPSHFM